MRVYAYFQKKDVLICEKGKTWIRKQDSKQWVNENGVVRTTIHFKIVTKEFFDDAMRFKR